MNTIMAIFSKIKTKGSVSRISRVLDNSAKISSRKDHCEILHSRNSWNLIRAKHFKSLSSQKLVPAKINRWFVSEKKSMNMIGMMFLQCLMTIFQKSLQIWSPDRIFDLKIEYSSLDTFWLIKGSNKCPHWASVMLRQQKNISHKTMLHTKIMSDTKNYVMATK